VVLLWSTRPRVRWRLPQTVEAAALLAGLLLAGQIVFGGLFPSGAKNYPLEFLGLPLLLWAAFRFGAREAATAIVLLSGIAIGGTLRGYGPFVQETQNESLLLLQAFMGVVSLMTLILAALVSEHRQVEEQLRHLSLSDPLTGLANYRQFNAVLEGEIRRSERTLRPFALLFIDVHDLKKINDRHGHLAGNRALCRLAQALRSSCRTVDTAARFGGDEFALVLPETENAGAWYVARRVRERLARDDEQPPISVSLGVAVYPWDGKTVEALLGVADRILYETKANGGKPKPPAHRVSQAPSP